MTSRFHAMMISLIAGIDTLVSGNAHDKRHRVCASIGARPWVHFVDAHLVREETMLVRATSVAGRGQRDPSRGCFESSDLEPIRRLLKSTVDKPAGF